MCASSETTAELIIRSLLLWSIAGWLESGFLSVIKQIAQAIFWLCWRRICLLLLHLCESGILIHRLLRLLLLWESHSRLLLVHHLTLTCSRLLLNHHFLHHLHHTLHLLLHRLHLHIVATTLTIHVHSLHLLLHLRHLLHICHLLWILRLLHARHRLLTHCLRNSRFLREWVLPSRISHIVTEWVAQVLGHIAPLHGLESRIVLLLLHSG